MLIEINFFIDFDRLILEIDINHRYRLSVYRLTTSGDV